MPGGAPGSGTGVMARRHGQCCRRATGGVRIDKGESHEVTKNLAGDNACPHGRPRWAGRNPGRERRRRHFVDLARPDRQDRVGAISGVDVNGSVAYRGIPYAAPPVGELRWKPPQPAAKWTGVRDGSQFGPSSPQQRTPLSNVGGVLSEDSLYLNVSTPRVSAQGPSGYRLVPWRRPGSSALDVTTSRPSWPRRVLWSSPSTTASVPSASWRTPLWRRTPAALPATTA